MTENVEPAVIDPAAAGSTQVMRAEGDPIEAERVRAEVRFRLFGGSPPRLAVGRFELGARLGAGGMGVVYAGRDPDLARAVALKVLFGNGDELRREAQALAKLRHPNVVSVHEIGVWQGLPFVAMELVDGATLRAWLAERTRSWPEIAAVMAGAGRGLAAAHAAGLVHRDFKLDNVLVDRDGQARVVDFGLAQPIGDGDALPGSRRLDAEGTTVTAAGTPAYMAPEVLRGEPATARADQFSFGVALYEAFAGRRPYTARDIDGLIAASSRPPPKLPPGTVPRAIELAIERCLAPVAADRYPDLGPVIDALAPAGGRSRGPWLAIAGGAGVLAIAAVLYVTLRGSTDPSVATDPCAEAGAPLAKVWNDERATAIATAFHGHGAFGDGMAARVKAGLDAYVRRWTGAATEACRAAQPDALRTLRATCLDDRRRQLAAAIARFADPDPKLVVRSIDVIAALPGVESCADTSALAERTPLPQDPAVVAKIGRARDRLADARARFQGGDGKAAQTALAALVPEVDALAYPPLTAETQLLLGTISGAISDHAAAQSALERAYREGIAGRHDPAAAEAAIRLAHLLGHVEAKPELGRPWLDHASALIRRIGGAHELEAQLSNSTGNLEQTAGHYDLAIAAFDKAERTWREAPGDHRLDLAQVMHNGGNARMLAGHAEQALPQLQAALGLLLEVVGQDHPYIAMTTNALTGAMRDLGNYEEALPLDQRVLDAAIRRAGPDSPEVAFARGAVGNDLRGLARYREAIEQLEQARARFATTFGPDHPATAATDSNLGAALIELGRYDEAEARLTAALAAKAKRGPDHPSQIATLDNLGELALRRGRAAEARRLFERSLAIGEAATGKDSPDVGITLAALGEAVLETGDAKLGKAQLERGIALMEKASASAEDVAPSRFALGRAQWALGEREAAVATVTAAVAKLTRPSHRHARDRATAWLTGHR